MVTGTSSQPNVHLRITPFKSENGFRVTARSSDDRLASGASRVTALRELVGVGRNLNHLRRSANAMQASQSAPLQLATDLVGPRFTEAEVVRPFETVEAFTSVQSGQVPINSELVPLLVASDSLTDWMVRTNRSNAKVRTFFDETRRFRMVSQSDSPILLGNDSTGLLTALGIQPERQLQANPRESEVKKLASDLKRILDSESNGLEGESVDRFRSRIESALRIEEEMMRSDSRLEIQADFEPVEPEPVEFARPGTLINIGA